MEEEESEGEFRTQNPRFDSGLYGVNSTQSVVEMVSRKKRTPIDYILLFLGYGLPLLTVVGVCAYMIMRGKGQ